MVYAKCAMQESRLVPRDEGDWVVEGAYEAVLDRKGFDEVQADLNDGRRRRAWSETSPYVLTGLVRCGRCGGRMTGWAQRRTHGGAAHAYYRCAARTQRGKSPREGTSCRKQDLEDAVVQPIVGFDAETLRRELADHKKRAVAERAPRAKRRREIEASYARLEERSRLLLGLDE